MTPDEAIRIVKEKAAGRTRYAGQAERVDEVLVHEIEKLRSDLRGLCAFLAANKEADIAITWGKGSVIDRIISDWSPFNRGETNE